MDGHQVAHRRMRAQRLIGTPLADPVAVVGHLGGVQAQEFPFALWGVTQRTAGFDVADVRELVDDGAIVRTHALRPTWHFLAPEDLGWIQALTGPRVHAFNAYYYRRLGIDTDSVAHTNAQITGALRGGNQLTRKELGEVVGATGLKLAYTVMHAELDALIVNGRMRGKQHTYALAEERIAAPRPLSGDEALAELTRRYFGAHGPATIKDFGWWSSLTVAQIKRGLALAGSALATTEINGQTLWYDHTAAEHPEAEPTAHLLQAYDEYVVAYSDTKFVYNLDGVAVDPQRYRDGMTIHPIIVDSQLAGFWRRPQGRLELDVITELTPRQRAALDAEVARHAAATS